MKPEDYVGKRVRPKHDGDKVAWSRMIGRVSEVWTSPGTQGEPVAYVIWNGGPWAYTSGYPLAMLELVRPQAWDEARQHRECGETPCRECLTVLRLQGLDKP